MEISIHAMQRIRLGLHFSHLNLIINQFKHLSVVLEMTELPQYIDGFFFLLNHYMLMIDE